MEGALYFDEGKTVWHTILNISQGGMLIEFGEDADFPEIGSIVKIKMRLMGKEIPIFVEGKILRIQNACVAIKFEKTIDLSAAMS